MIRNEVMDSVRDQPAAEVVSDFFFVSSEYLIIKGTEQVPCVRAG